MSFFSRNCKKDEAYIGQDLQKTMEPMEEDIQRGNIRRAKLHEKIQQLPRWIEVEGYKALKSDMTSFFGKMQYEFNHVYGLQGEVTPCEIGYHLCLTLKDAMKLFPPVKGTRYFKVKATVPASVKILGDEVSTYPKSCAWMMYEKDMARYRESEKDYNSYTEFAFSHHRPSFDEYTHFGMKYVAKTIEIIEEVPFAEISDKVNPFFIQSEEDYKTILTEGDYKAKALAKWSERTEGIFSTAFAIHLFVKALNGFMAKKNDIIAGSQNAYEKLDRALYAIEGEKISQDLKVMFMLESLTDD